MGQNHLYLLAALQWGIIAPLNLIKVLSSPAYLPPMGELSFLSSTSAVNTTLLTTLVTV